MSTSLRNKFCIKTLMKTKFIRRTQPLIFEWLQWTWDHFVSMCDIFGFFRQFAQWLVTQDLHKSHNGMIFSNKARLLLDFSRAFQNVSACEIMWKIKQSLFIYLSGYGSCWDCFLLFCLSHCLVICISTWVMWEHSHFVLRKFAKPAKVHAFQTLVIFRTYHNRKTCFSTIFREIITSTWRN